MLCLRPDIVVYVDSHEIGGFIVEALAVRRRLWTTSIRITEFLARCHQSSRGTCLIAAEEVLGLSDGRAEGLVDLLVSEGFLVDSRDSALIDSPTSIMDEWARYGWGYAAPFMLSIYDFPFLDYLEHRAARFDYELMTEYVRSAPPPSIYKNYFDTPFVPLPRDLNALHHVDVWEALELDNIANSTLRKAEQGVLKWLPSLLLFSLGEIGKVEFHPQGSFSLKCVPSGGARHPIEAYLIIGAGEELGPGVYHYSVCQHGLELINQDIRDEDLQRAIPALRQLDTPCRILIVLTGKVERTMWRYREPRSYRVIHHDLGHIVENLALVARVYGLEAICTHGFHDSSLEELLLIDGMEEPALRVIGIR